MRTGMLTDVYGEAGAGKSQLCFTLCVNSAKNGNRAIFLDTAGTFRPERIVEIAGSASVLDRITLVRILTTHDQKNSVKKILDTGPQLVAVDSMTSLFSAEYSGPARHLAVMRHLHELALVSIKTDCAVVITNMVRSAPAMTADKADQNIAKVVIPSHQREYLGSSVSIYSHMKLKLETVNSAKSLFRATLMQPVRKQQPVPYTITLRGISDVY